MTCRRLLSSRETHEPQDSRVRLSPHDCELAEVLVQGDKDSTFAVGSRENVSVARVMCPVARPDDIVTERSELRFGSTPNASIA
jgi:hypothetical protein